MDVEGDNRSLKGEREGDAPSATGIVVLAAGASTRLGAPKQLLNFRGKSLLRRAVETAVASLCRPVIVVLGAHAAEVRGEIENLEIEVIENTEWADGLGSSIRVGINRLNEFSQDVSGAVIMLCDQPLISTKAIDELVKIHHETGAAIVASEYKGTLGVPALFARAMFPELMNLRGDKGAKQIIEKFPHRVGIVAVPHAAVDIDTRKDYESLQSDYDFSFSGGEVK